MARQIHVHVHRTTDGDPALNAGETARVGRAVSQLKAKAQGLPAFDSARDTRKADQYVDQLYEIIKAAQDAIRIIGD